MSTTATTSSGIVTLIKQLESTTGLVTFSSFVVMIFQGTGGLDFSFKKLVRWMVYLDFLAFVIYYSGKVVDPTLKSCTFTYFSFCSDFLWALKDGCRIGYLMHRGLVVHDKRWPGVVLAGMAISVALYFLYMGMVYRMSGDCLNGWAPSAALALYIYWLVVELACGALVVVKLHQLIHQTSGQGVEFESHLKKYRAIFRFQELRVLISVTMMAYVAIATIINASGVPITVSRALVFTFSQLILLMSSTGPQGLRPKRGSSAAPATDNQSSFNSRSITKRASKQPEKPASPHQSGHGQ